jgi:sec-independent protein translocase protein TatC
MCEGKSRGLSLSDLVMLDGSSMTRKILHYSFSEFSRISLQLFFPELFVDEHGTEAWQRSLQTTFLAGLLILLCFVQIKPIVEFLELPILEIHFFQNSPGEFFLSTLKIAFYTGLLFSIPIIISQLIFFLLPALTGNEKNLIVGLLVSSNLLFVLGLTFSFFVLIPAALHFFLTYGLEVIEPLWSFDQYLGFILLLFLSTGIIFQIPILQVVFSLANILTGRGMLGCWKYILVFSTLVSAILTPSADPITQLLLASAIFFLYLLGTLASMWFTFKRREVHS